MLTPQTTLPLSQTDVVVLCPQAESGLYRTPLMETCRVAFTASPDAVIQYLSRVMPWLVIVDADRGDLAVRVCDAAKAVPPPRLRYW